MGRSYPGHVRGLILRVGHGGAGMANNVDDALYETILRRGREFDGKIFRCFSPLMRRW